VASLKPHEDAASTAAELQKSSQRCKEMKLDLILSKQAVETNIGGLKIDVQKAGEGGQVSGTTVCQGAVIGPIGDKARSPRFI
jgi:hypothetical protein